MPALVKPFSASAKLSGNTPVLSYGRRTTEATMISILNLIYRQFIASALAGIATQGTRRNAHARV